MLGQNQVTHSRQPTLSLSLGERRDDGTVKIGLLTGEKGERREVSVIPPASQDSGLPDQHDLPRGLPAPLGGRKSLSPFYKREIL